MSRNTLNLVGDGDDLDVICDVERTFDIQLSNQEAEDVRTVGDLYDLILSKRRSTDPTTRACLSQAVFYRLRNALTEMGLSSAITPTTPLQSAISAINLSGTIGIPSVWKELGRRARLRLPPLELSWMRYQIGGWKDMLAWVGIITGAAVVAFGLHWLTGMNVGWAILSNIIILPIGGTGIARLLQRCFGSIPRRIQTVGDLARECAGFSFRELWQERKGCAPSDLWFALTAILRAISGRKGPIDRDTTFLASQAQKS